VPRKTKTGTNGPEQSPAIERTELNAPDEKPSAGAVVKPRKSPARKASKQTSGKKRAAPAPSVVEPTDEEIRLRAYYISERRHRLALPGDASSDWLEAKRQLLSETGRR
jgi:hypothetical protein